MQKANGIVQASWMELRREKREREREDLDL